MIKINKSSICCSDAASAAQELLHPQLRVKKHLEIFLDKIMDCLSQRGMAELLLEVVAGPWCVGAAGQMEAGNNRSEPSLSRMGLYWV